MSLKKGYTFNIHVDCQVYMLSDFQANSQKRGSEVKERQTNLIADKLPSATIKQILFGEMLDNLHQGIQAF